MLCRFSIKGTSIMLAPGQSVPNIPDQTQNTFDHERQLSHSRALKNLTLNFFVPAKSSFLQ